MKSTDNPADPFKKALAEATKVMANDPELSVSYSVDPSGLTGDTMRLPQVSRRMTRDDAPAARALYDAVEQARVEALGARRMAGMADNLSVALEVRCRDKGFARITEREQAPVSEAVAMLVREALTGAAPPPSAKQMVDLWRPFVESKIGPQLTNLDNRLDDQEAFQDIVRQMISDLGLADDEVGTDPDSDDASGDDQDDAEGESTGEGDGEGEARSMDGAGEEEDAGAEGEEVEMPYEDGDGDMEPGAGEEDPDAPGKPWRPPEYGHNQGEKFAYLVYKTEFDEEIRAEDLAEPQELERLRAYLDQQLEPLKGAVSRLANKLQRRLQAQQNRSWEFDLEEGHARCSTPGPCRHQSDLRRCRLKWKKTPSFAIPVSPCCWTIPARCGAVPSALPRSAPTCWHAH